MEERRRGVERRRGKEMQENAKEKNPVFDWVRVDGADVVGGRGMEKEKGREEGRSCVFRRSQNNKPVPGRRP